MGDFVVIYYVSPSSEADRTHHFLRRLLYGGIKNQESRMMCDYKTEKKEALYTKVVWDASFQLAAHAAI